MRVGPYLKLQETVTVAPVLEYGRTLGATAHGLQSCSHTVQTSKPLYHSLTAGLSLLFNTYNTFLRDKGTQPPRKYYVKTVPSTARVPETISVVTSRTAPAPALRCQRRVNSSPKLSLRWLAA